MKVLKVGFSIIGVVLVGLLLWGSVEPYFLSTEAYTVSVPNLPDSWEGKKVALIADWQVGMRLGNEPTVRRSVTEALEEQPDVVLIAGDFVYKAEENTEAILQKVREALEPLGASGVPAFAVLGNHDYGMNKRDHPANTVLAAKVTRAVEDAGVTVLQNQTAAVEAPGADASAGADRLYIVGIGPRWPESDQPSEAFTALAPEAARIVLMHNPNTFPEIGAGRAPLALAGHTHGGQISLPYTKSWSWLQIVQKGEVHADGWIEDGFGQAGNRLYVNRGIGFSTVPLRVHCTPEVTILTLIKAAQETAALMHE